MQHIACGLQGNQGGPPWKRVCNDTDSLNQPTTKHGDQQLGLTSIMTKCAQTPAAEATRCWRGSQITQCDLLLLPVSRPADLWLPQWPQRSHKVRPTFEAFLIDDDGVVLRSLCQTEKLASEWERQEKKRQIKHWMKSLRKSSVLDD